MAAQPRKLGAARHQDGVNDYKHRQQQLEHQLEGVQDLA